MTFGAFNRFLKVGVGGQDFGFHALDVPFKWVIKVNDGEGVIFAQDEANMFHPRLHGFREGSAGRGVGRVGTLPGSWVDWDFVGTCRDPLGQSAKFGGDVFNHDFKFPQRLSTMFQFD